jgi:hypothetical protein
VEKDTQNPAPLTTRAYAAGLHIEMQNPLNQYSEVFLFYSLKNAGTGGNG